MRRDLSTDTEGSAILTAGHVARPIGATVDDATGRIGTVVWSDSLEQHAPAEVCADAAVVVSRDDVQLAGGPVVETSATADQRSQIVSYGQRGPLGAWLRAPVIPSFALTTTTGASGDVFLTSQAISIGGDSGAPVLLDGTNSVVGLIVAGANSYSLVQDISFVLGQTNTRLVPHA